MVRQNESLPRMYGVYPCFPVYSPFFPHPRGDYRLALIPQLNALHQDLLLAASPKLLDRQN